MNKKRKTGTGDSPEYEGLHQEPEEILEGDALQDDEDLSGSDIFEMMDEDEPGGSGAPKGKAPKPGRKAKKKGGWAKERLGSFQNFISKGKEKSKESTTVADLKKAFAHISPKKALLTLALGILGVYRLTGIYIVNPGEQAVIRRFGAVQPTPVSGGIHYRLPFPFDEVQKVNVSEVRRADVGMSLPEHMHENDPPEAIQLITGDANIITSEAIVHYKVSDAAKFLYNVNSNDEILVRGAVEASLVQLMSRMAVDDILSTEKVQAQNCVVEYAQGILDGYDSGIQLTAFNIQAIVPPGEVSEAFRDVTTAREDKERSINEANGYYNSVIPEARGKANTLISEAEAYKVQTVNTATGDAEKFLSMLEEYRNNSQIYTQDTTKYRLLLETLEKVMPKLKLYIMDSSDGSIDVNMFDPSLGAGLTTSPATQGAPAPAQGG